jgi:dienelactone hydrolase
MKTLPLFAAFLFFTAGAEAQTHTPRYVSMSSKTNGYYEYLPQGYDPDGTATYPLILFMTGIGEFGNGRSDLPNVLKQALPQYIKNGAFPKSFTVGGQTHRFIVITPQFVKDPRPTAVDMDTVLNYIIDHYKVNTSRIYITGLSYGGGLCWAYTGASSRNAKRVAAIVPVASPVPAGGDEEIYARSRVIAENNVPVWATHNRYDPSDPVSTTIKYTDYINEAPAPNPLAKRSIFNAAYHNAWTRTYDPNFKEQGLNVYEWMLQYQRGTAPPPNAAPQADAGPDQELTLPASTATLSGTGTDSDGSIAGYAWEKRSGPAGGNITDPDKKTTTVTNLQEGTYTFRLTVTDNDNATATDDVTITVHAAPNQVPEADAGPDITITLPVNSATLSGGGTDADGTIASYLWTKHSGPNGGTFSNKNAAQTTVNNLEEGTYTFRLQVTDNDGATATDDVIVLVNPEPEPVPVNTPPIADAGMDQTVPFTEELVITLRGSGTDSDGTIASYQWTQVAGPATATVATAANAVSTVTGLQPGSYVFQLTVTDNNGATATDAVSVEVTPPAVGAFQLQATPNPATGSFLLKLSSPDNGPVLLRITDYLGRVVENRRNVPANGTLRIGHGYQAGVYFAELIQGSRKTMIRIVKLR